MNTFFDAISKEPTGLTANGAEAFTDTHSDLVNYFSNCNYLHRTYEEVEEDLNKCWEENPQLTLRLIAYIRTITRTSKIHKLTAKGLGLKNEGRLAIKWLYLNHITVFHTNLNTFIEFGCWKDLWTKELIGWVDKKDPVIINYIAYSLISDDLCKKYLPRYKSSSNILKGTNSKETITFKYKKNKGLQLITKALSLILKDPSFNIKKLMELKVKGQAHSWQQLISNSEFNNIDFNSLPGKVLNWITKETTNGSFLSRHKLEDKYIEWLETKENLNTTSYIYELIKPAIETYSTYSEKRLSKVQKYTIEKQIKTILNRTEISDLNVMPVLDTSGSMDCTVCDNSKVSALDICLSLGIYFSMIQKGNFKDHVIAFDNISRFIRLSGSYLDRLKSILKEEDFMGSTNFQSVISLILKTKKNNPNIPIEDYPDVYLVISDMQFNETNSYDYNLNTKNNSNHSIAVNRLTEEGLPQPLFIWYNVSSYGNDNFQNHKDDNGVMMLSGFDPSTVDRLMSKDFQLKFEEKYSKSIKDITPYETMQETLNQEYLQLYVLG